jgi:hypothetical protein
MVTDDKPPKGIDDARAAGVPVVVLTGDAKRAALDEAAAVADPLPDVPGLPRLPDAALYGLPGDVVRAIEPTTEADPAAILLQYLVGFGSIVGSGPRFYVEATAHGANLFVVLTGATAAARKGTSWDRVAAILRDVDPVWYADCKINGLSTGEGLIFKVRDPRDEPDPNTGKIKRVPGVEDKRLLAFESELARVFRAGHREASTLTAIMRQAWDSGDLRTLTKVSPDRATGAHVSIVGHIVPEEARKYLSDSEVAGGLGNRFLWAFIRRSKLLPEGGRLAREVLDELTLRTREAVASARRVGEVARDEDAREVWRAVYPRLSAPIPGMLGAMLARGPAQVVRLSLLYALADKCGEVRRPHLEAALALWRYCEASVRYVFGESLGDPVADRVLSFLRERGERGATRHEINREALKGHTPTAKIATALGTLEAAGLAHRHQERAPVATPHRPVERWYEGAEEANKAEEGFGTSDSSSAVLRSNAEEGDGEGPGLTLTSPSSAPDTGPRNKAGSDTPLTSLTSQDSIPDLAIPTPATRPGPRVEMVL